MGEKAEGANGAAVKAKEASMDAHLKAFDDKVAMTSLRPESREILMLLPLPRPLPMLTSLPTMPELHGRRISSREDRTRTDSSTSTRTPPPRPLRSKASTTRERELTADSSRPSPLSEHVID